MTRDIDLVVIGGGIMGATAALRAAEGGMRVIVLERDGVGSGASGVNAGTLSLQIKRVKLMPYAMRGHAWWQRAPATRSASSERAATRSAFNDARSRAARRAHDA